MKALKPNQERAAILLASGRKLCEVAKEVGVTPETMSHWQHIPEFKAYCNQARLDFMEATRDKLRGYGPQAVEAIADIMRFSKSDRARLRAAETILGHLNLDSPEKQIAFIGSTNPDSHIESESQHLEMSEVLAYLRSQAES